MSDLKIFENTEFGQVRMVEVNGKPYAVGVDVAKALEYANPSKAVIDHCKRGFQVGNTFCWRCSRNQRYPRGRYLPTYLKSGRPKQESGY